MEVLESILNQINSAKSFNEILIAALDRIQEIINCKNGLCVVFKNELLSKVDLSQKLVMQKDMVENRYYNLIATSD